MSSTAAPDAKRTIIQRTATVRVQASDGQIWLDPTIRTEQEAQK